MVAIRSQLTFYEENIRQKRQPRPRFHPAFRLMWVLPSRVWSGWKSAADLMKPKTVLKWHERAFLKWWRWKSRRNGGRPTISQEMRALIRRLSREKVLWSAEFPWSAVYITSTSEWQMKTAYRDQHSSTEANSNKGCVFWRPARPFKRHLVT